MEIRKKGMGFTILAMIILATYSYFYLGYKSNDMKQYDSLDIRGSTLKNTKESFINDFKRALEISGKRAVLSTISNITDNGNFINNPEEYIICLLMKKCESNLMGDNTIIDWIYKFNYLVREYNIISQITYINITVKDYEFDSIAFYYTLELFMKDNIYNSYYNNIYNNYVVINTTGIEDPYLTLKTDGYIRNTYNLCTYLLSNESSNTSFFGYSYITYENNLSYINDKYDKILVTDTLYNKTGYDGFGGYILSNSYNNITNYAFYVNISKIKNNTIIIKNKNYIWLTGQEENSTTPSCYFSWSNGLSFTERMKGHNNNSNYKIACLIPVRSLPSYLIYTTDYQVIDTEYFE